MARNSRYLILALLVATFAGAAAVGAADDSQEKSALTGAWTGTYRYPDGREAVKFEMLIVSNDRKMIFMIREPKTFGAGNSPWLHAVGQGSYNSAARQATFIKSYDGTGDTSHDVKYTGTVSSDGKKMEGGWSIDDFRGTFSLKREPTTRDGKFAGVWVGQYAYPDGSGRPPVQFLMMLVHRGDGLQGLIMEPNTFGQDPEPFLHASVRGAYNNDGSEIAFAKTYDGTGGERHTVNYRASVDDPKRLSGKWKITDDWTAPFKLERRTIEQWAAERK